MKHYSALPVTKTRARGSINGRRWVENDKGYPTFEDNQEAVHAFMWKNSEDGKQFGLIPEGWDIHHIDAQPMNFDPENLVPLPRPYHKLIHVRAHGYGTDYRKALPDRRTLLDFAKVAVARQRQLDWEYEQFLDKYKTFHLLPPKKARKIDKKIAKRKQRAKKRAKSEIHHQIAQQKRNESLARFEKNFGPKEP